MIENLIQNFYYKIFKRTDFIFFILYLSQCFHKSIASYKHDSYLVCNHFIFYTYSVYFRFQKYPLIFIYNFFILFYTAYTRSFILFFMYLLFLSLSYQLSSAFSHNSSSLSLLFLIILLASFSFIEIFSTYFFLLCVTVFLFTFVSFFLFQNFLLFLFLLFYFFFFFTF